MRTPCLSALCTAVVVFGLVGCKSSDGRGSDASTVTRADAVMNDERDLQSDPVDLRPITTNSASATTTAADSNASTGVGTGVGTVSVTTASTGVGTGVGTVSVTTASTGVGTGVGNTSVTTTSTGQGTGVGAFSGTTTSTGLGTGVGTDARTSLATGAGTGALTGVGSAVGTGSCLWIGIPVRTATCTNTRATIACLSDVEGCLTGSCGGPCDVAYQPEVNHLYGCAKSFCATPCARGLTAECKTCLGQGCCADGYTSCSKLTGVNRTFATASTSAWR